MLEFKKVEGTYLARDPGRKVQVKSCRAGERFFGAGTF